jgi:2-oxoglutarate ferredoxin oxidoreductase subunit gamma
MKVCVMNNNVLKLIIAGFGGQGVLFAGKLLAQSAMLEGKNVTWFPSYGAEIRGGTANCTVIVSKEMIGSPTILNPNALVAMNAASTQRFSPQLEPGGILITNTSLIEHPYSRSDLEIIGINATDKAKELGSTQTANIIMLGALIRITGIVHPNTVIKALREITPGHKKHTITLNTKALKKGLHEIEY